MDTSLLLGCTIIKSNKFFVFEAMSTLASMNNPAVLLEIP